jgi:hypothetical protein
VKRPGAQILDTTLWPGTDFSVLETRARQRYQKRAAAIEFYIGASRSNYIRLF